MNYIWLSYNQMIDLIKKIDIEARLFWHIKLQRNNLKF